MSPLQRVYDEPVESVPGSDAERVGRVASDHAEPAAQPEVTSPWSIEIELGTQLLRGNCLSSVVSSQGLDRAGILAGLRLLIVHWSGRKRVQHRVITPALDDHQRGLSLPLGKLLDQLVKSLLRGHRPIGTADQDQVETSATFASRSPCGDPRRPRTTRSSGSRHRAAALIWIRPIFLCGVRKFDWGHFRRHKVGTAANRVQHPELSRKASKSSTGSIGLPAPGGWLPPGARMPGLRPGRTSDYGALTAKVPKITSPFWGPST